MINVYEVVRKLIGGIEPVGDSNVDEKKLENLKRLIELSELIISDIKDVTEYKNDYRHSMKEAGICADNFMKRLYTIWSDYNE